MKTQLIAAVALPAGTVAGYDRQIDKGDTFETDPEVAEALLTAGQASLASQAAKKERAVKVRVLSDCAHGKANAVVELPESVAKHAEKAGLVDADKAAVAYASELAQNQKGKA